MSMRRPSRIIDAMAGEAALRRPTIVRVLRRDWSAFRRGRTRSRLATRCARSSASNSDSVRRLTLTTRIRGGAGADADASSAKWARTSLHARGSPCVEQQLHRAVILEPQRRRRDFEHHRVVLGTRARRRPNQGRRRTCMGSPDGRAATPNDGRSERSRPLRYVNRLTKSYRPVAKTDRGDGARAVWRNRGKGAGRGFGN